MPANKFLNAVLAWQLHVVVMTELSWVLSTYVRAMLESYCNDSWASSLKISILASKSSLTVSERLHTEAVLPSNGGGTAVSIWSWLLCLPMRVLWAWHCAKDIFPVRTQCEVPGPPWEPVCHHQLVWPDLLDMFSMGTTGTKGKSWHLSANLPFTLQVCVSLEPIKWVLPCKDTALTFPLIRSVARWSQPFHILFLQCLFPSFQNLRYITQSTNPFWLPEI